LLDGGPYGLRNHEVFSASLSPLGARIGDRVLRVLPQPAKTVNIRSGPSIPNGWSFSELPKLVEAPGAPKVPAVRNPI